MPRLSEASEIRANGWEMNLDCIGFKLSFWSNYNAFVVTNNALGSEPRIDSASVSLMFCISFWIRLLLNLFDGVRFVVVLRSIMLP